ncbi:MAG: ATP-binding protein [Sporichthyaceae bacterium]
MGGPTPLVERRLLKLVPELMRDEPVVVLAGPRTVGKSTLLRCLAQISNARVLDLDDPAVRRLVADDLGFYVGGPQPVFIDEFQHVPTLLDAIKAELNRDTRPGRFVLTGSTRFSALPHTAQSLTGRVHIHNVWPLSQGELGGAPQSFVQRLLDEPGSALPREPSDSSRADYAARVLAGGLPAALAREGERPRTRWFDNYVSLVIERDLAELRDVRQAAVLSSFLRRLASQTAQVLNIAAASRAEGLTPTTGEDYTRLLEAVFLVHRLPAWGTTLSSRVNKLPKVHVVDVGLGGRLLGITGRQIESRRPAVMTEFGHLLESFAVNEVLAQAGWLDRGLTLGHYRTSDGHEVDLVIEEDDGSVVALEIKAGSTYRTSDLRGLAQLRDKLGERFKAGYLLHTGEGAGRPDAKLYVAPIDVLWGGGRVPHPRDRDGPIRN